MVAAPRRDRGAGEDRVDEEGRRHLLQPQPGPPDLARNDVEDDGSAKAEEQEAAQQHQHGFERVEHAPFEVGLPLEHQSVAQSHDRLPRAVMAGLVPATTSLQEEENKTWMSGTRPGMTSRGVSQSV